MTCGTLQESSRSLETYSRTNRTASKLDAIGRADGKSSRGRIRTIPKLKIRPREPAFGRKWGQMSLGAASIDRTSVLEADFGIALGVEFDWRTRQVLRVLRSPSRPGRPDSRSSAEIASWNGAGVWRREWLHRHIFPAHPISRWRPRHRMASFMPDCASSIRLPRECVHLPPGYRIQAEPPPAGSWGWTRAVQAELLRLMNPVPSQVQ